MRSTMRLPVFVLIILLGVAKCALGARFLKSENSKGSVLDRSRPSWAILQNLIGQEKCVKTPQEFVEAFTARSPRCVDEDLVARISSSRPGGIVKDTALNVSFKPIYFWSGHDALEKYLRIGYPETIGDYTVSNKQNYQSEDFQGVQEISNGQGFMQAVGYPGEWVDITSVYSLNVYSRAAIKKVVRGPASASYQYKANIEALSPTWDAVRHFVMWSFQSINLTIPNAVSDTLDTMSADELTGCPSQCAYSLSTFPSADARTPIITKPRGTDGNCPTVPNATIMPPTSIELTSSLCKGYNGKSWTDKYTAMANTSSVLCSSDQAYAAANLLKEKLENTDDVIEQAQWFRAYLVPSCNGGFNALFSGNGITYSGNGGLLTGQSSEYIISPFDANDIPPKGKAALPFCVNGLNGGKPQGDGPNGKCPPPS